MITKRSLKRLAAVIGCLMLVITAVYWAAAPAYAADDSEYTFVVKVYSGKEGSFARDGGKAKVISYNCKYGEEITLRVSDFDIKLNDPDTYYVRGFKLAGHDNDEELNSYTFTVKGDASYSVAYGLKGGMVKYTVNYVDEQGNNLLEPEEFYGMAGDKPVVSYRYVEGYTPNMINQGKTLTDNLTDNEDDNVFTFVYTKGETAQPGEGDNGQNNPGGTNPNPAGAGNAAAGNNAAGTNGDGDGNNGPAYQDLDDGTVPLSEPETPKTDPSELARQSQMSKVLTGAVIAAAALLLVGIVIVARRKKNENDA